MQKVQTEGLLRHAVESFSEYELVHCDGGVLKKVCLQVAPAQFVEDPDVEHDLTHLDDKYLGAPGIL